MKRRAWLLILFLWRAASVAEELDLRPWEELSALDNKRKAERSLAYVPATLAPVNSAEGVFQQVLDYQVQLANKNGAPTKIIDTKWHGSSQPSNANSAAPQTSYELQPIQTKGSIDFNHSVKASINYQIFLREMDVQLSPEDRIHGIGLAYSYVTTPVDSQNRLLIVFEW
jgi:hypothetical protein